MDSNHKHNNSDSKLSETHRAEKHHTDSPLPKIFSNPIDTSTHVSLKSLSTPPKDTIQEERPSLTSSKFEDIENKLPPTPPSYPLDSYLNTPARPEGLFRNIDYTGMSREELISRSARRVRVLENGEEVPDVSWTEFKSKLHAGANNKETDHIQQDQFEIKRKTDMEAKNSNEHDSSEEETRKTDVEEDKAARSMNKTQKTKNSTRKNEKSEHGSAKKKIYSQKHPNLPLSQDADLVLRRSERLAKIKSESARKRKITPGKPSSKKLPTNRHETDDSN